MNLLKKIIGRTLLCALMILFIVPALLFSVLVLELAESAETGAVMLGSLLVLVIALMLYDLTRPPAPSRRKAPPSLQDIYRELGSLDADQTRHATRGDRNEY